MPSRRKTASPECVVKLKVLAEATRLGIVELLMDGAKHVGELQDLLGIDQSLCSHHLRVLRDAGLVKAVRDGKAVLYSLAPGVDVAGRSQGIDLGCCRLSFP